MSLIIEKFNPFSPFKKRGAGQGRGLSFVKFSFIVSYLKPGRTFKEIMKIYYNPKFKQLARNLRKNGTLGEILLWNELKAQKMCGYQFMRQKPIGNYIADFYCSKLYLIIEVDGKSSHRFKLTKDLDRQQWLEEMGLTVLRFEEQEVRKEMRKVLSTIEGWIRKYEES